MAGPWEDFAPQQQSGPWDDYAVKPKPMGQAANADFLKAELANTDWGTRNIAAFGTALSDLYEGAKQLVGKGDLQRIKDNKTIAESAPVGAFTGNAALTAIPFGAVGNGWNAAAKVGTVIGALNPVESDNAADIVKGKILGAGTGGATAAVGQGLANTVGRFFEQKVAQGAIKQSTNAPLDKVIRDAVDAGYVTTPSSVNPSWFNTLRESAAGKIATAQEASVRNAGTTDALARRALGLAPDEPITPEALKAIRQRAYESGYAPVAQAGRVTTDDAYHQALDQIVGKHQGAAADFPGVASDAVSQLVNGKGGTPARSAWVDGNGNVLSDFVEPKAPPLRNLLDEIKKAGGISTAEVGELGQGIHKTNPGLLRKQNGQSSDGLLEWMTSNGWINPAQIRDAESMPGGATELAKDMVRSAIGGEKVVHPLQSDAMYAYNQAMQDISDSGIKRVTIPGKVANAGGLRVDSFDAGNALKMSQILRDEAKAAFRTGDNALGKAKREASKAIEDQIERGLSSAGAEGQAALQKFREARQLMAKTHTVEDALVEGGGTIDARKIGAMYQRNPGRLSDELAMIGAFANNFPKAVQPVNRIAGPAISKLDMALALASGITGGANGGYEGGVAGALAPVLLSKAARIQALSKMAQRSLANRSYGPSAALVTTNALAKYLPVGSTVLGGNALAKYLAP
jgi:hypothetical protein